MTTNALDADMAYELMSQPLNGHFYERLYDGGTLGLPKPHTNGYSMLSSCVTVAYTLIYSPLVYISPPDLGGSKNTH